jgi:hypothetical protein
MYSFFKQLGTEAKPHGVDFYIYPTDLVERQALFDVLKDLVV